MLGSATVVCVGVGAAIGSGIFATPGEAALHLTSAWWILAVWVVAGFITLLQSLVTAELATRFPQAGAEYQYLKAAYGDFAAFFFGWSFTVFIVGGGAATIAAALGEFAAALFDLESRWAAPLLGSLAIVGVMSVNLLGLRTGALAQNALTILKVVALLAIAVGVLIVSDRAVPVSSAAGSGAVATGATACPVPSFDAFMLALLPVFWAYSGATDSAKLAEEVKDVHRALPRALLGTVLLLTVVYVAYNYALLCALPPAAMAGTRSVPALAFAGVEGLPFSKLILGASVLICLGAISSVFLANVRVPFALARDGLTFRWLGKMSRRQAPVGALLVAAVIACAFVLSRSFGQILRIYFLASAVLFGLTYVSLIVFRVRDSRTGRGFPSQAYKAPAGKLIAVALIIFELVIAERIIAADVRTWQDAATPNSYDSLLTLALLAAVAVLYLIWSPARRARR